MKMNVLAVTLASLLLATTACSSDDANIQNKTEIPATPIEPSTPGDEGEVETPLDFIADFTDWEKFKSTLNSFGLKESFAKLGTGLGRDGKDALHLLGSDSGNAYAFTVQNRAERPTAKAIEFYIKGTSPKSLSFNVYSEGKNFTAFNLGSVEANNAEVKLTAAGQNDYNGVINATDWVKVTLDLTGVTYNQTAAGDIFAIKIGKEADFDLIIDNIYFSDVEAGTPGEPEGPGEPEEPGTPGEPGEAGDFLIPADQFDYYKNVDFTLTGMALKAELGALTLDKHTKTLSYGNIWEASKVTDLVPGTNDVYLIYGHKGVTSGTKAYTRSKNNHGRNTGQWNREHTYAKSLGTPDLGTSGPGADAHHLRPADVSWNGSRDNLKFAAGNDLSGNVSGGWYPGDEWKGDVARMMMYMYLRYEGRCLPSNVANGAKNGLDSKMVNLLLQWNAEDPVSEMEKARNDYHGTKSNQYAQGNRNPFIDNPYLATQIWGEKTAENLWAK